MLRALMRFRRAGVKASFIDVFGMSFRKALSPDLVEAIVRAHKAQLGISIHDLDAHKLAGGSPIAVVNAAITLQSTRESVEYKYLSAVDLAGMPVMDLATAFAAAARRHSELRFTDVVTRFQAKEDVLGAAQRGELAPPSAADSWLVRVEQGPYNFRTLMMLLRQGLLPRNAWVKAPGQQDWRRAESVPELGTEL